MGTRDRWIFILLFSVFSALLFVITAIMAQLEPFLPKKKRNSFSPDPYLDLAYEEHQPATDDQ